MDTAPFSASNLVDNGRIVPRVFPWLVLTYKLFYLLATFTWTYICFISTCWIVFWFVQLLLSWCLAPRHSFACSVACPLRHGGRFLLWTGSFRLGVLRKGNKLLTVLGFAQRRGGFTWRIISFASTLSLTRGGVLSRTFLSTHKASSAREINS